MSDEDDWDFASDADAKVTIHAAVRSILKGAAANDLPKAGDQERIMQAIWVVTITRLGTIPSSEKSIGAKPPRKAAKKRAAKNH
jgi:hypothetical protein